MTALSSQFPLWQVVLIGGACYFFGLLTVILCVAAKDESGKRGGSSR